MSTPQDAKSQLDALVSLISASVSTFTSEYQTAGISLPSLDDIPSASSSSVNSSAKLSEEAKARVVKAVKTIEAACAQLTATVSSPGHIILNVCASPSSLLAPLLDSFIFLNSQLFTK